ncbi:MAG TPA: T9SS type A sorting domain-containing protein [Rubricoccaceae bacterium]|nr:T9SS type A sorting domain-containing protein [Rubricoccaceae bacterium]
MKTATRLFALGVLVAGALAPTAAVRAQGCTTAPRVTVRQIHAIPQANIDQLMAAGQSLTPDQIRNLLVNDFYGDIVKFTAVVMSDWRNSGLASWNSGTNMPNRIHVFVRDTTARSQGVNGMTIQIVDDTGTGLIQNFEKGDVIDVCGEVAPFVGTGSNPSVNMQINPVDGTSITLASVPSVPESDPLRQPVLITTDDITRLLPNGRSQLLWSAYNAYHNQYVRMENTTLVQSVVGTNERVNMLFQSIGDQSQITFHDISLRFRNDRDGSYQPPYNVRPPEDPFIPPTTGTVNIQGFLVYQGFDFFDVTTPRGAVFSIDPMEDSDFEVITGPPIVTDPSRPDGVPGNAPVTITVTAVVGDPTRTLTSVVLNYAFSTGGSGQVNMVNTTGDEWEGQIPAAPDGAFVTYSVTATDNTGASTTSGEEVYRVLYGGITNIEHIQRTSTGLPGESPFNGLTTTTQINLDAVVQAAFTGDDGNRYAVLQDDPGLGEWTGVWVFQADAALAPGDRITITGATVSEFFGLTQVTDLTFTETSTGAPYPHKVLPTGVLNGDDPGLQEAHEGMMLRFSHIIITDVNADGPDTEPGFGEWAFANDGNPANDVRADDFSDAFGPSYNIENFTVGQGRTHMQGGWYFSFSNFKLIPIVPSDVGGIVNSNEPVEPGVPGRFALERAYPNPFNPATTIRYSVGAAGPVRLAVYDVTGREVAVLVDGPLAPSVYEATFDASGLASGVYVVRLAAGGQVLSHTITLLK